MESLAQRLSFWDMAYAAAGVARVGKGRALPKGFCGGYVEYCRSMDDLESDGPETKLEPCASPFFALGQENRKSQMLTPMQETPRG